MYNGSFGPITQNCFLAIRTAFELSNFVSVPVCELEGLINEPPYQYFTLDKKKGGQRQIQAPLGQLKRMQRTECSVKRLIFESPKGLFSFKMKTTFHQLNFADQ